MNEPLISVGVSVFNSEATLAATMASLFAQSWTNWELILIDDGSRDGTLELARSYDDPRIRLIADGRNLGLAARLNQAIDLARGELFARIDADDIAFPERFAKQVAYLNAHPEIDLLGTAAVVFRREGEVVGLLPCSTTHAEICRAPWKGMNGLLHPTWMGRTAWFRKYRFDTRLRKSQDRDILLRSFTESRFSCLPEVLLGYRQETLDLAKILRSRAYFSGILGRAAVRDRNPAFVWGIALQAIKGAADVVAVTTRLNYRLLRHRATKVDDQLLAEWDNVWRTVSSIDSAKSRRGA